MYIHMLLPYLQSTIPDPTLLVCNAVHMDVHKSYISANMQAKCRYPAMEHLRYPVICSPVYSILIPTPYHVRCSEYTLHGAASCCNDNPRPADGLFDEMKQAVVSWYLDCSIDRVPVYSRHFEQWHPCSAVSQLSPEGMASAQPRSRGVTKYHGNNVK